MSKIILNFVKNYSLVSNHPLRQISVNFSSNKALNKQIIDKSKVPVLKESELKEEFIHGSGPGGQNVNKLSNCVQLTHLPTGIVVKCHQSRLQQRNRVIARELLQSKLDDLINGDESVAAQRHRLITERHTKREKKREKIRELKTLFKEVNRSQESENNDLNLSRDN